MRSSTLFTRYHIEISQFLKFKISLVINFLRILLVGTFINSSFHFIGRRIIPQEYMKFDQYFLKQYIIKKKIQVLCYRSANDY